MSRTAITLLLVTLLLIGLGIYEEHYISTTAEQLIDQLAPAEKAIKRRDWDRAEKTFKELAEGWSKKKDIWAVFLHHDEIDNIDTSVAKVAGYTKTRDKSLALAEIITLRLLISHIPEMESLSPSVIF